MKELEGKTEIEKFEFIKEQLIKKAVEKEDYLEAARLRDLKEDE